MTSRTTQDLTELTNYISLPLPARSQAIEVDTALAISAETGDNEILVDSLSVSDPPQREYHSPTQQSRVPFHFSQDSMLAKETATDDRMSILKMSFEGLVEEGLSNLNSLLELECFDTLTDALCVVRDRTTSKLEKLCNMKCLPGDEVHRSVDSIMSQIRVEYELSVLECEEPFTGSREPSCGNDAEESEESCDGDKSFVRDESPTHGWDQVIDLERCASTLVSLLSTAARSMGELSHLFSYITTEEFDLFTSLADCSDDGLWTLKKKASTDDVQNGIMNVWNATMSVAGASYKQAADNAKELVTILGASQSIIVPTVFYMYSNDLTTYMKYDMFRPRRREDCPSMLCVIIMTSCTDSY